MGRVHEHLPHFIYCGHQRYVNEVDKMWRRTDIKMTNPLRNFETVFSYYLSYHGENDVETYKKIADITQR